MLEEELELEISDTEENMKKVITNFQSQLNKIRTGRANPLMLESVLVDCYGSNMPLNQLASISVSEGKQLIIKPYDRSILKSAIIAITKANLDCSLQDQGDYIRLIIPQLTEETRKNYVREVKKITEEMRVNIRNLRRDINEVIKKSKLSEDVLKLYQKDIQDLTDSYIKKLEIISEKKSEELMTI